MWNPDSDFDGMQSKYRSFEKSAIKVLHKAWFPDLPWSRVERRHPEAVTWKEYCQYVAFPCEPPFLTFFPENKSWSLNFHKLIHEPVEKLPFYQAWEEQPSDGLVFPLVGLYTIIHKVEIPPAHDCLLRHTRKGELVCVETLQQYALPFGEMEGFYELREGL